MTDQLTSALVVANLVGVVVALAYYAWYGFALSRLFPKLGAEGWKGWVPVLNEIEILVRGGVPGWNVVFFFIPIVQLYGIYLKAMAVHRINESFGKGAGHTVLGIFLPPLWATLLAASRMPADGAYDRRVEGLMAQPGPGAPSFGADALGAAGVHTPPAYASAPPPPPPAAVRVAFPAFAATPEPPLFAETPAPPAPPVAPPAPLVAPPTPTAPPEPPALTEPEGSIYYPWASSPPAPPAAPPVSVRPPEPEPEPAPVPEPVVEAIVPPSPAVPDDDDDVDETVVVDRRPAVPWRLLTDEGHVIPLRTRTVLLGRKPVAPNDTVAAITVPDSTRTISKNHARLELADDGTWTIHDLRSTNGVIIVEPDGTETLLPEGGSAPVPGRFLLGKVAMRVTFDDTEATR